MYSIGRATPILETERLRLREFRADDFTRQAPAFADPAVYAHLGGSPIAAEDAWRKMLCGPGLWALLGYGYWALERTSDGRYVGQVGFADFKRDIVPSIEGEPEMGWIMMPDAHGKGYASEAIAAGLAWAEAHLDAPRVACIIDPANAASLRVAEKAGFAETARTDYKGDAIVILHRPNSRSPAKAGAQD